MLGNRTRPQYERVPLGEPMVENSTSSGEVPCSDDEGHAPLLSSSYVSANAVICPNSTPGTQRRFMLSSKQPHIYSRRERAIMERYESVDTYEPSTTVYKDHLESRSNEPRWFIWVFVLVLGVAVSAIAILMVSVLHVLTSIRYELLGFGLRGFSFIDKNRYPKGPDNDGDLDFASMFKGAGVGLYSIEPRSYGKGYLMWVSYSFIMALISVLITALVPESAGSGMPEVMAYLNGVNYPNLGSFRTLVAKLGSVAFSVASGVCTGHCGTLMLTGAMLGAQALQRRRYLHFEGVNIIECFRNPRDRRTIAVIGIAAGVASAFSVSIGGLMVVLELISTFIPVRFALYVFAASLISSLSLQIFFSHFEFLDRRDRSGYASGELISEVVQIFSSHLPFDKLVRMHILYFVPAIVIGLVCGLLSAVFARLCWSALLLRQHIEVCFKTKASRYLLPVLFTVAYVSVHYFVVIALGGGYGATSSASSSSSVPGGADDAGQTHTVGGGPCATVPQTMLDTRNLSVTAYYGANGFFCNAATTVHSLKGAGGKQVWVVLHSYASLAFANAESALQLLLSCRTEEVLWFPALVIFLVIYFLSSATFLGISLCGDTILPGLVIGAGIGRVTGVLVFTAAGGGRSTWADPGSFALIGAGSFVGGTTGLTFSICTILMESTGEFQHLLPLMVGIMVAKKTAELFTHNINSILLKARCVPMLDFGNAVHKYPMFDARHVMSPNRVVTLETVCTLERVLEVLRGTRHAAFPVESINDRTYKGIVTRSQLEIVIWNMYFSHSSSLCSYERGKGVEARLFRDGLQGVLPPMEEWKGVELDLSPYIDHSGFCVLSTATLPRAYEMFLQLGLRHLTVVNHENKVVGIITRKDLMSDKILEATTGTATAQQIMSSRYWNSYLISEPTALDCEHYDPREKMSWGQVMDSNQGVLSDPSFLYRGSASGENAG
ncbi:Voltage gated chloride channel CBS domain [Trypanosoma vivax]|nr:Voltage gated chloride channel CBS domain [Trypanosoma vivax]